MARIPLQVAQRGLDTGNVVQYPTGGQVGAALEGFGGAVQSATQRIADAVRAKQEQQDGFDARIRETEFSSQIGSLEMDAAQNAPADGSGIHDSVYGEIDPESGRALKPGSFDKLFDAYLERMPESKRADFAAKRETYRLQGSNRLAAVQYKSRQEYEKIEIQKVQNQIVNSMLSGDPNDVDTFEKFKQQGLDLIDASGLSALDKDTAKYNWLANADETLFKTKLAKDPEFATKARAALGLAPPAETTASVQGAGAVAAVVNRIIGVESGGNPNAKNPRSSAGGLGQFIDSTWVNTIRKHRPDIAAGKSAAQIIALKTDPALNREMTAAHTRDNAEYLSNRGVPTTAGNLYLAHFAGSDGAVQILKADPGASVASVLGQDKVRANPFLEGMTASDLVAWAGRKMGGGGGDPAFANIPPDRRQILANEADRQVSEIAKNAAAQQKAEYTSYKDAIELSIVQGGIVDEAIISNDRILNDGDKATLIRSVRTQNETANQIKADLAALSDGTLTLDPYAAKDKTRADNLYADAVKRVPPEQQGAVAGAIIEQTGVVPQPIVNAIRQGLSSQNPADVVSAAQLAQRISRTDSAALGRRDGGGEVQSAADDFAYYVDRLNLSPEDAARRLIDARDPQKQRDRKALEPAAKEFRKEVEGESIAAMFDDAWFSDPQVGFTPGSEYGIKAEFLAIAEDKFYANNGNADLAMNAAKEEMKRLYGVTRMTGRPVVMKHPPERYWPAQKDAGGILGIGADHWQYVKTQLHRDIVAQFGEYQAGSVSLVAVPETDAMVKRGEMPGYAVMWQDEKGNYQTLPGKLWRPDMKALELEQKRIEDDARREQIQQRQKAPYMIQKPEDFLSGNDPAFGAREFVPPPEMPAKPTVKEKVDQRRKELFDNAPDTSFGGAM